MPYIAMCRDLECPSREKCYRFTAKPSGDRQSWMCFNRPNNRKRCDYYMPNFHATAAEINEYNGSKPWK